MAEDGSRRQAEANHNPSELDPTGTSDGIDTNEEHILSRNWTISSGSPRRTASCDENIGVCDSSDSDSYLSPGPPSPAECEAGSDFVAKRLLYPDEYFQELDDMGAKIFHNSMFHYYTDGTVATPFDGTIRFKAPFLENASFQTFSYDAILRFCVDVANEANEDAFYLDSSTTVSEWDILGLGAHSIDHRVHHRTIEHLAHLIECRNIVSAVWESVKQMKSAAYCGGFISVLVLDHTRRGVARLVRIQCPKIEQLTVAFETCVFQVMSCEPAAVLFNTITTIANDVSAACQQLLTDFHMRIPRTADLKDIWRCAVHALDVSVLSYAVAHTQSLSDDEVVSVSLPGPFLQNQYFKFCRRSFSCLGEFLGGQKAWVLEQIFPGIPQVDQPSLSLLTDAETFGDIWGPMWKSCVLDDKEQIVQYNVGNGVILPWNLTSPALGYALEVRKGEVFCHWMSDRNHRDDRDSVNSSSLHQDDLLLIGASIRLSVNGECRSSTSHQKQSLRNSGALSEPGTIKNGRILSSEIVQAQVGGPYGSLGLQREYKRRGRPLTQCLFEDWKRRPLSRHLDYLEFKLGLEVSTCTHNARRVRLIKLLGTQTMLNHLRNGPLRWESTECEEKFYSIIQSGDYTAFRKLYKSPQPGWQIDLGNAIQYCLDALEDTGKREKDLDLFWAPDGEPGLKVTFRTSEISWIGFLAETETSGTLAILEDKCLEHQSLKEARRCRNVPSVREHVSNELPTLDSGFDGSILETSVLLNELCIPDSIRGGRIESSRQDGSAARHGYRWSVSMVSEGDRFGFGSKGFLEVIKPLDRGQILAKWGRIPDILLSVKNTVLGGRQPPKMHYECMRDGNEITSPVRFFIINTATNKLHSDESSRRPSAHANSTSVESETREYHVEFSENGQPRTGTPKSSIPQPTTDRLREVLYRWRITQPR